MIFKRILNYINGYLKIIVEGYFIERFINICGTNNIELWNLVRKKTTLIHANISLKQYRKVVKIAKKTKCKIKIQKKKGLPFIFNKYRKRKTFLISIIAIIIILLALSNFIWKIEITGAENIPNNDIMQVIEEAGLKVGQLKGKIDTKEIINKLRLDRNDIAWAGIEIVGIKAKIQIVEATKKPDIIDKDEHCNIVSTKKAVVVKVKAQNGTPRVQEGDVVKEGQILIEGVLEGKYTDPIYVHSEGQVEAKVWYTNTQKIYYKNKEERQTGNKETKYTIKINNFKINFYKMLTNFEKYDTIREEKTLRIFNKYNLPIKIIKVTNFEKENEEKEFSKEEVIEVGKQKAIEELNKSSNGRNEEKLLNTNVNVYESQEYVEVEVTYEVLEDIGIKEKNTV